MWSVESYQLDMEFGYICDTQSFCEKKFTKFTKRRTEFNPQIDWTAGLNASLRSVE